MKRKILILLILANSLSLFAQSSMSDLYKQWMIEDINSGKFDKAAQEITHIEDWTFDPANEKAFVDVKIALSFATYLDSIGVDQPQIDSLFIYVEQECGFFVDYLSDNGIYDKAIYSCDHVVAIRKKIFGEYHPKYASALNNLGLLYRDMGDYTKAEQCLLRALEIRKKVLGENHPDYAGSLTNLGILYRDMGDYTKAEQCLLRAMNTYKDVVRANHPDYAKVLSNLGGLYSTIGDYSKAEQYCLRASEIAKGAFGENHPDYALVLKILGGLYHQIGDYEKALRYNLRALEITKDVLGENHPDYASSLNNFGIFYQERRYYTEAEQYYLRALEIVKDVLGENHPTFAGYLSNLGGLYHDMGDYTKAEQYYLYALDIKKDILGENNLDYANSLNNLGMLYFDFADYAKAEPCLLKNQGLNKSFFLQSLDYMSEQQRKSYWDMMQYRYAHSYPNFTYHYYIAKPSIASFAYNNEIFTKGLLLASSETIRYSILASGDTTLISQWNELKSIKQQIVVLEENNPQSEYLSQLREEAELLEKEITKSSAAYRKSKEQWNITWDSVRNHLNNEQVAIEYMVVPLNDDSTMYCALLLRSNSEYPEMIPLFEEKEVLSLIHTEVDSATNHTYSYSARGAELSQKIWSKILPFIKPGETIYFAPSGLLHQVAIEALPYDEDHTMSDIYNLVRVSSTREIVLCKEETQHTTATLYGGIKYDMDTTEIKAESEKYPEIRLTKNRSLGDATTTRKAADYLEGSKTEVEQINQMLKSNHLQVQLFTSTSANEESFKALSGKHQNILHIATHGFYWSDSTAQMKDYFSQRMLMMDDKMPSPPTIDPLNRCGLLFAGANTAYTGHSSELPEGVQDGILAAKEISLLDLRDADLVVLSACETGKGEITGEGVFGLQRAFKQAGAQTIIMSLWPVDDKATQLLMTEFYRNWITNHQSKREAFKNAQNAVRNSVDKYGDRTFQAPVYWAGFIMLD